MTPLYPLITILTGLVLNAVLIPIIIRIAHKQHWYDARNHRKIHVEDTPRIGGIGIFVSFLASALVAALVAAGTTGSLPSSPDTVATFGELLVYVLPAVIGMTLIHALGLIDDFRDLRAVLKLLIQVVAAAVVTLGPFRIETITVPYLWYQIDLGWLSYPLTILWIAAVSNAVNFVDGVDGLAGGISAIAALFFGVIALLTGHGVTALVAVGLFGAILGFLIYNAPPARIFMGDSGSYVLGFALAVFPLMLADESRSSLVLIPAISILAVPFLDMTTSIFRRLRRGKHPFSADREHLHHKLMDLGFGTWRILAITYSASVILGVVGVMWYLLPVNIDITVTLAAWLVAGMLMALLTRAQHRHGETADE